MPTSSEHLKPWLHLADWHPLANGQTTHPSFNATAAGTLTTAPQPANNPLDAGSVVKNMRNHNPLAPITDDVEMQANQDPRANQLANISCINCKCVSLEAMDHLASWTYSLECLRHISNP